ncbi:hypothetical protein CSA37_06565 [Candidatus Fermentibacteria bacterium]|nr:MAG: hypothetical protein CSA37_06565 [Candidatus Fermentibacteria bacterium]
MKANNIALNRNGLIMNTKHQFNNVQSELEFQGLGCRKAVGKFDGGHVSTDGGAILLRFFGPMSTRPSRLLSIPLRA